MTSVAFGNKAKEDKVEKIGTQNGIEAARRREKEFHPKDPSTGAAITAWDQRAHTFQLLVGNTNALIDRSGEAYERLDDLSRRLAAVEARPAVPFPASG